MASSNNQVFANDVSVIDATQVYPLGTLRTVLGSQSGVGDQVWRYVKNDTALAFTQGQVVMAKAATLSGGTGDLAAQDTPKVAVLGVAQTYTTAGSSLTTFGAGAYGWVLCQGYGTVRSAAAGVVADVPFAVSATAGSVYATAAVPANATAAQVNALAVIGYNHTAIVGATTGTAYISCRH